MRSPRDTIRDLATYGIDGTITPVAVPTQAVAYDGPTPDQTQYRLHLCDGESSARGGTLDVLYLTSWGDDW